MAKEPSKTDRLRLQREAQYEERMGKSKPKPLGTTRTTGPVVMPDRKVRAKQPDGSIEHQIDRRQREVEEIEARQAGREIAERVSEKFSEALTKSQERRLAAGRKGKVRSEERRVGKEC